MSLVLRVEVACDGDAFEKDTNGEVGRILLRLAKECQYGGAEWQDVMGDGRVLVDRCGNTVGRAWFEPFATLTPARPGKAGGM